MWERQEGKVRMGKGRGRRKRGRKMEERDMGEEDMPRLYTGLSHISIRTASVSDF